LTSWTSKDKQTGAIIKSGVEVLATFFHAFGDKKLEPAPAQHEPSGVQQSDGDAEPTAKQEEQKSNAWDLGF